MIDRDFCCVLAGRSNNSFYFYCMRILYLFSLALLAGCASDGPVSETGADSTVVISYDTIPETRAHIRTEPAASYSEPIPDELNDWKFSVSLYETRQTFQYTIRVQAKEVRVTDSLTIPNFCIQPTVAIRKGEAPLSCIIGFLDKKQEFKPYKRVSFQNDRLQIKTINSYYVGSYKTKKP